MAMINVVGGFLVTHRMLGMFGPKRKLHRAAGRRAVSEGGAAQGADRGGS